MEEDKNLDIFDKKVGEIEHKSLSAKKIIVLGFEAKSVLGKKGSKNEGNEVGKKLILKCKHPDKVEPIEISNIKYVKGESIKVETMWINLDEDGNIQKGSMVSILLGIAKVDTIREMEAKELDTELNSNGYLCIKAY